MKQLIYLSAVVLLLGCTPSKQRLPSTEDKLISPLPEETQAYINLATRQYHRCLSDATRSQAEEIKDSRDTTQVIVTQCEPKLEPIRERLLAAGMPTQIANRYLRRKRVQATRSILRRVMYMQSQNQSQ